MRYNIFSYLVGEGFRNVLKNKKSTSAALTIMCMAMFIFGIFFILGENINYVMEQVESAQGMQVFLYKDTTDVEIAEVENEIRNIDGVNTIEFVSNIDALNETKENLGEYAEVYTDGLEDYFQDSFIVTLTDLELNEQVYSQIKNIEHVEDVTSANETIEKLVNLTKGIRIATFGILVILVIISIFIITNTIKLTVHARRKEISIMKYVGATNSFIRWPFIVEGIIIGIVSSIITVFIVGLVYNFAASGIIQSDVFKAMNLKLYTFSDMFQLLLITYILLGAGIGIVGSSISMRKYLEV